MLSAVQMLDDNPHPAAAESLARQAVFSNFEDVRAAAIQGLKRYPLDHFAPLLLSGLQTPIEAESHYALAVTVRTPGPRMKIRVAAETITATLGHPFWVAGQGWRMTKQLEAGWRLHTLSGAAPVETVEKLPVDPSHQGLAYNLIVADFDSYFVGDCTILVHDNTPRRATSARLPGLVRR